LAALAAVACGRGVAPEPKLPQFSPEGQTKCGIVKSSTRPLIVEWPAADRAQLEAAAKRGIAAVRYSGCEMEVLPRCSVTGSYRFTPTTRKLERVAIRDADELYAELPVGAAKLEGKLEQAGVLEVAMHVVGRYDAATADDSKLQGACDKATHVITGLTVGAFEFSAGATSAVSGGAGVLGAKAGASSSKDRQLLNRDGDAASCASSASTDQAPPDGCAALLRVEVTPISDLAVAASTPLDPREGAGGLGTASVPADVRPGPGVVRVFINSPEPLELHGLGVSRLEATPGGFRTLGPSQLLCRGECGQWLDARVGQRLAVGRQDVPFSAPISLYDREGDVQLDVEPGSGASMGWGVASLGVGTLSAVTGLSLLMTGFLVGSDSSGKSDGTASDLKTWGLVTLGGGAALIGVGVVLMNDGSTKVQVRPVAAAK
jgi:hypothetical protein